MCHVDVTGVHLISIPAPPRGATEQSILLPQARRVFQFPPLREGRPGNGNRLLPPEISIHAPPRGATDSEERNHGLVQISIRAPPRGATFPEPVTAFLTVFQFPPLREGRQRGGASTIPACYFNSRPSARGDSSGCSRSPASPYFNSRPSARGDALRPIDTLTVSISIPASPRGATDAAARSACSYAFQFPPLREGRPHHEALFPAG